MTKKKILTLLLCLALIVGVTLPTTLAISSDSDSTSDVAPEEPVMPIVEGGEGEEPENPEEPGDPEDPEQPEEPEEPEEPEQPADPEEPAPEEESENGDDFAHIASCDGTCSYVTCECPCHFFDQIMACTSIEDIEMLLDNATEEQLAALTEEQLYTIWNYMDSLEPEPLPEIVPEASSDVPVESEFVYRTVNYTNVAPLVGAED